MCKWGGGNTFFKGGKSKTCLPFVPNILHNREHSICRATNGLKMPKAFVTGAYSRMGSWALGPFLVTSFIQFLIHKIHLDPNYKPIKFVSVSWLSFNTVVLTKSSHKEPSHANTCRRTHSSCLQGRSLPQWQTDSHTETIISLVNNNAFLLCKDWRKNNFDSAKEVFPPPHAQANKPIPLLLMRRGDLRRPLPRLLHSPLMLPCFFLAPILNGFALQQSENVNQ